MSPQIGFYFDLGDYDDMVYEPTMEIFENLQDMVFAIVAEIHEFLKEEQDEDMRQDYSWSKEELLKICREALPSELLASEDFVEVCAEIEATDFGELFEVDERVGFTTRLPQLHVNFLLLPYGNVRVELGP